MRSLLAHPARNLFTAISVALAMGLVTLVVAAQLSAATRNDLLKGRNNLLVMARGPSMPLSYKKQIEAVPGVSRVLYMFVTDAESPDGKQNFFLHGTTADYMTIGDAWFYVAPDDIARWEAVKDGAIVARQTAKDINAKIGDRLTFKTERGDLPVTVAAFSKKGYKATGVLVHHDYYGKHFKEEGKADVFWVGLSPESNSKSVGGQIDELFRNSAAPSRSVSSVAFLKAWARAGKVIPTMLTGAGLIILFATLLVTANTVAITIRERSSVLATLRAIGFRRSKILRLLLTEVLILCLFGGVIGVLVPMLLFKDGVDMTSGQLMLGKVELPTEVAVGVLALSAVVALLASVVPAWRASRADVATALRANA